MQSARHLLVLLVRPGLELHFHTAGGDLGGDVLVGVDPVDAVQAGGVAVAQLAGELGLADAAQAGGSHRLGDGSRLLVVEQGVGEDAQVVLATSEVEVGRVEDA